MKTNSNSGRSTVTHLSSHCPLSALLLAAALVAGFVPGAHAQYALPWYEPFPASYTNGGPSIVVNSVSYPGTRLNDQIAIWSLGAGGGGGSPTNCGGAALTYPDFGVASGSVGLWCSPVVTTGNRTRGVLFVSTTTNANPAISNTVYCSLLLNVQAAPTTGTRQFAQLSALAAGTATANCLGLWIDTASNVLISKNSTTVMVTNNNGALSAGTHLIVARYTFSAAANNDDQVDLWVDPPSGTFGADESSVPTPNATTTVGGNDLVAIQSFYVYHPSSGFVPCSLFIDEIQVATNWARVTSATPACFPASIVSNPTNLTVVEGISGTFRTIASGTSPSYQWQASADAGGTWNNVTLGQGGVSPTYVTPPPLVSDNGNQYRCIVNVSCDGSSATSAPVTLTVTTPAITPPGVVLNDTFTDFSYQDPPVTTVNSVWYSSAVGSLDASGGTGLFGFPGSGSSVLWLGYCTADTNAALHLDVWRMLKATLVFTPSGVAANTNNGIRIGLFDYADAGGWRPTADGTLGGGSGGNAANVRGYMLGQNFDTVFSDPTPQTIYARNGLADANLMGTTADYASLGSGPAGLNLAGAPGFVDYTTYTLEFSVVRTGPRSTRITTAVSGGGTNWTTTVVDNTYAYHRFDSIGLRPNNAETTATAFNFTQFKVEVIDVTPTPIPLQIQAAGTNVVVSWTVPANQHFTLQNAAAASGPYTSLPTAVSPYTTPMGTNQHFFRLLAD